MKAYTGMCKIIQQKNASSEYKTKDLLVFFI